MIADKKNYIPSIVIAAIGIVIIYIIPYQIDLSAVRGRNISNINSRTLPYFISVLIIFLSILELFFERKRKKNSDSLKKTEEINSSKFINVFFTFTGIVLWIIAVPYLGFIITTTLLLIAVMLLMGNRKWLQLLLVPLLTGLILNYVFTEFVGRNLPQGIIFY